MISVQETRSHMLQLKILNAATKTQCKYIYIYVGVCIYIYIYIYIYFFFYRRDLKETKDFKSL